MKKALTLLQLLSAVMLIQAACWAMPLSGQCGGAPTYEVTVTNTDPSVCHFEVVYTKNLKRYNKKSTIGGNTSNTISTGEGCPIGIENAVIFTPAGQRQVRSVTCTGISHSRETLPHGPLNDLPCCWDVNMTIVRVINNGQNNVNDYDYEFE